MSDNEGNCILIVDDNPVNIDLLRRYLEPEKYKICAVTSGEKALDVITKVHIDLILLDIMMPGIDGYDTCRALKKTPKFKDIPVIFVTAKVEPEDLRKGFSVGGVDYITKPVQQDIVLARVKNQLSQVKQYQLERNLIKENLKMAELGKLVAGITHEVSSPLSTMMLSVDHILSQTTQVKADFEQGKLDKNMFCKYLSQLNDGLNLCKRNSERATNIMLSFKHVAVDQCSNALIEFNLCNYVEDILLTLRPKLKAYNHQITLNIASNIQIDSFPGAFSQIMTNLINNSLIHGFQNGQKGKITISATLDGQWVKLIYQDTGCGMTEEQKQNAFKKFYTTKAGKGGSGLGLALCKELVENTLNGHIYLESEAGAGCKFNIDFLSVNTAK